MGRNEGKDLRRQRKGRNMEIELGRKEVAGGG